MDLKKKIKKDTDCEKEMISLIPNTLVETRERFSNSGVEVVVPTINGTVNYTVLTVMVMRIEQDIIITMDIIVFNHIYFSFGILKPILHR